MIRNLVSSRSAPSIGRSEVENGRNKSNEKIQQQEEKCDADGKDSEQSNKPKNKLSKYKPFKNTALVLRDVKNSIELRMKARHESKSFAKLTNELATPSAKLYSPFNIYTPSCSGGKGATGLDSTAKTKDLSKSARRNKLNKKRERVNRLALEHSMTTMNDSGLDCSMTLTPASTTTTTSLSSTLTTTPASSMSDQEQPSMTAHGRTPRDRIAWRHKKHLMQENVFASFASPTGRLRETVKDVEHFQQCIEDISMAIRARGGGGN